MKRKTLYDDNLRYLYSSPKKLNWKIVVGPPRYELSDIQKYDLIFDTRDLKIRQMDTKENLKCLGIV